MAVIDMDVVAAHPQQLGRGEPGRAGADHADGLATRGTGRQRLDPAFGPGGVGDELLDTADRDCAVARKFNHAIALAQPVLRADPAADLGHGRGRVAELIGLAEPPLGGQSQPVGNVIVEWAMDRAIGYAALRAARSLRLRRGRRISVGNLAEVLRAQFRLTPRRIILRAIDELQGCGLGHGWPFRLLGAHRPAVRSVTLPDYG